MESLSDNWLQWMEMIWSVLTQMRFALREFAVKISICLGLVLVDLKKKKKKMVCMCVFCSQHWNIFVLRSSSMTSEYSFFVYTRIMS